MVDFFYPFLKLILKFLGFCELILGVDIQFSTSVCS